MAYRIVNQCWRADRAGSAALGFEVVANIHSAGGAHVRHPDDRQHPVPVPVIPVPGDEMVIRHIGDFHQAVLGIIFQCVGFPAHRVRRYVAVGLTIKCPNIAGTPYSVVGFCDRFFILPELPESVENAYKK